MRSALLCVFFALVVHKGRATTNEFRPTPIPLDDSHGEKKDEPAGTLQEVIATDAPPSVAAVPAHYWEDALRHSVYLTLVRDKIDQLIAKGSVISPDNKLEVHASKEIDDHNLWEKIKSAPFDRLSIEEPTMQGDITIMSKGRLLEDEKSGYRFTEDKTSKDKCDDVKCLEGVKAFWSVKRVRQRDVETNPGKYHYELTFSVNSQAPKKHKKPYENSVRTFTVREGTPVEHPQYKPPVPNAPRPQRAVWFHKNIVPNQHYQSRKNYQPQGLERFFLSLFSSEEDDEPPQHRPNHYTQQGYPGPQHSKVGHTGAQPEQHQQKKPYPYKPMTYKYSRPPLGPPPSVSQAEHHYADSDKLKIQFSPPQVQFQYPDSDTGKLKIPISPPQLQPQYIDEKIKNPYPQIQPQYSIDSEKTKNPLPQIQPQYIDSDKTEIPFSQQVQHYLEEVKSKYPYTPTQTKYHYDVKLKVQPPVQHNHQHHYREPDMKTRNPYPPQPDNRHQPSNLVKTTRPGVLPTPPTQSLNFTMEVTNKLNVSEITTKDPEIVTAFKPYQKPLQHKPPPTKISYFPEHVRPPVFNAPPGVFVTMDKKPFKPMPPLKYHQNHHPHSHSKPMKTRPVDFRPSPQVVDIQLFSDPDPHSDAFRPMAINYADNTTDSSETSDKPGNGKHKNVQHKNLHKSKPPKKHEQIKSSHRTTTSFPDIITAQSQPIEESDSMHWANNLLGAFVKTTPMISQEAQNTTEITTPFEPATTVTEPTTTVTVATTTEQIKQENTTTTSKPTKRTRPPPKFTKPEKLKKHKRVTTTTTSTTSTTTTTEKPRAKRPQQDLIPQASSAATGTTKPGWQSNSKMQNETTTTPVSSKVTNVTSTTARPVTTSRPLTTTTKVTTTTKLTTTTPNPTPKTEPPVSTTDQKSKNRLRQSTLMLKGTSINHDKWNMPIVENNRTRQSISKYQQRRKGSNFQGYVSSTPKNVDEDHHNEDHTDLAYNSNAIEISSTTEMLLKVIPVAPEPNKPSEIQVDESDYPNGTEETETEDSSESSEQDEEEESKDHTEFIFGTQTESVENSNDVVENQDVKRGTVVTATLATVKNKTKCKKKKHMNLTTTEDTAMFSDSVEVSEIITTTTEQATTQADIFSQIFGGFTVAGLPQDNKTKELLGEESENQERFVQIDDDLEDFLDSLEGKKRDSDTNYDQYDEEDNEDSGESDYSPFSNEEESRSQRHADIGYEEYRDRPYSFLELMAME